MCVSIILLYVFSFQGIYNNHDSQQLSGSFSSKQCLVFSTPLFTRSTFHSYKQARKITRFFPSIHHDILQILIPHFLSHDFSNEIFQFLRTLESIFRYFK